MTNCIACGSGQISMGLDFGLQPVSTNYLKSPQEIASNRYPLNVVQCRECALVQLSPPFPAVELVPPFEWIFYKEPEGHLDDMVDVIESILSSNAAAKILGVSYKEESSLQRLQKRGFNNLHLLDVCEDLGASSELGYPNIESVPSELTIDKALKIAKTHGPFDVVIARHVLEHAADVRSFICALRALLGQGGLLVVEVPDCEMNIRRADVSMLWEEHSAYFTTNSLRRFLKHSGFSECLFKSYKMKFENCLVSFAHVSEKIAEIDNPEPNELFEFENYCSGLVSRKEDVRNLLQDRVRRGEKLAVYGAGHLAETFLNLFDMSDMFDCVIDDTPHKQGLFMPGSRLPVLGREALLSRGILHCVLAISVEVEEKVIMNNGAFREKGGTFSSCLVGSDRYITSNCPEN